VSRVRCRKSRFLQAAIILACVVFNVRAQASIAVIVNNSNQNSWERESVKIEKQIKDIFLGKKDKFPDGSPAKSIDQAEGEAQRNEFYAKIANKDETEMNAYWSSLIFTGNGRPPKALPGDSDVKKFIRENISGIGYIDEHAVDNSIKVIYIVK
jgi:hypothetical protein